MNVKQAKPKHLPMIAVQSNVMHEFDDLVSNAGDAIISKVGAAHTKTEAYHAARNIVARVQSAERAINGALMAVGRAQQYIYDITHE